MPDVAGKQVLVRVDHNVATDPSGELKDDTKLRLTLPTLKSLTEKGAHLTLMTHVGRPKGEVKEELRTAPIAAHLKTLCPTLAGINYRENVRFDAREKGSSEEYARELIGDAQLFVNEAFASLHTYEETSTCAVARLLPSYAGYHLMKEVSELQKAIQNPGRPLVLVISGAKMKTKIPVIRRFLDIADHILLGGCIANTFIAAQGHNVGGSKYEEEAMELATELMQEAEKKEVVLHVPCDVVAEKSMLSVSDVTDDMKILDVGEKTVDEYATVISGAKTIIWNGPLGLYEFNRFADGTKRIAEEVAGATKRGAFSVIGGGDTLDFHTRYQCPRDVYSFVSSGGGAMLEFLSAEVPLPALIPLMDES